MGVALACVALLGGQLTPAYAAMVGTTTVLQQAQQQVDRAALLEMLDRGALSAQLVELGVDPVAAKARVAALTDEEVGQLNQRLAEMPAGGDALGIVLAVFIILIITDMLGATDVFPFVHSINK
ncbi:MAG TPA: DUF6627 family protein [Gammaproteobacteria bacterium]